MLSVLYVSFSAKLPKTEVLLAVLPARFAGRVRRDDSAFLFTPKVAGPLHHWVVVVLLCIESKVRIPQIIASH